MSTFRALPNVPGLPPGAQKLSDVISEYSESFNKAKNAARFVAQNQPPFEPVTVPTSITLDLEGTSTQVNNTLPITPRSPGSPGRPPQLSKAQRTPQTIETITFDVATNNDGFTQTVAYSFTPRQSTHQTAGGFYVDEFGTAPGSLSIDVIALATDVGDLANRLSKLKAMLDDAKLSNPLSPDFPTVLRFINAYDGCAFILTQTRIDFRYSAEEPNRLAISIGGDILQDYSTKPKRGATGNIAAVTTPKADLLVVQDESILNYTA